MKLKYTKMEIKIEELDNTDVITASGTTPDPEEIENIYFGFWGFD